MQLYQLSFPNGKKYIGITSKTAKDRFNQHCNVVLRFRKQCQHAIHKYGKENVVLTVLATVDNWELLCLAEIEAIEKFNTFYPNGYNMTLGGEGVMHNSINTINMGKESRKISNEYFIDDKLLFSMRIKKGKEDRIKRINYSKITYRRRKIFKHNNPMQIDIFNFT